MNTSIAFPEQLPPGYDWMDDEVQFDPSLDLQLEHPARTYSLRELGYTAQEVANKATPVACSEPFRVLSARGAGTLLEVCRRLRSTARRAGDIDDPNVVIANLEHAVEDVQRALDEMRAGEVPIEHYGE